MKLIEKAMDKRYQLTVYGYSRNDIIRNMCPAELGLAGTDCRNEDGRSGIGVCEKCWLREYGKAE